MAVNLDNFHVDLVFTVYDGTERTLPRDSDTHVLVLLFDSNRTQQCTTKKIGQKMHWYDDVDDVKTRISIGDAWARVPERKNMQYYPKAGRVS